MPWTTPPKPFRSPSTGYHRALPELKIFVISLRRATERRRHMERLLSSLGLNAEFVDAVDGSSLTPEQQATYDRDRALRVYGAEMTPAEIGCHLSHLSIYERIVREGLGVTLVLEDDIECDGELPVVLEAALRDRTLPWLVLRLQSTKSTIVFGDRAKGRGLDVARYGDRVVGRLRIGVLGGCGYLIKPEGARRMLRYASRPFMPIDQTMDRFWENGIVPFVLRPFPIRQCEAIPSEIGDRKVRASLSTSQTVLRRVQRFEDAVRKRYFQLTRLGGWPVDLTPLAVKAKAGWNAWNQGSSARPEPVEPSVIPAEA